MPHRPKITPSTSCPAKIVAGGMSSARFWMKGVSP